MDTGETSKQTSDLKIFIKGGLIGWLMNVVMFHVLWALLGTLLPYSLVLYISLMAVIPGFLGGGIGALVSTKKDRTRIIRGALIGTIVADIVTGVFSTSTLIFFLGGQ